MIGLHMNLYFWAQPFPAMCSGLDWVLPIKDTNAGVCPTDAGSTQLWVDTQMIQKRLIKLYISWRKSWSNPVKKWSWVQRSHVGLKSCSCFLDHAVNQSKGISPAILTPLHPKMATQIQMAFLILEHHHNEINLKMRAQKSWSQKQHKGKCLSINAIELKAVDWLGSVLCMISWFWCLLKLKKHGYKTGRLGMPAGSTNDYAANIPHSKNQPHSAKRSLLATMTPWNCRGSKLVSPSLCTVHSLSAPGQQVGH